MRMRYKGFLCCSGQTGEDEGQGQGTRAACVVQARLVRTNGDAEHWGNVHPQSVPPKSMSNDDPKLQLTLSLNIPNAGNDQATKPAAGNQSPSPNLTSTDLVLLPE